LDTPALFVILALIAYGVAYFWYSRWYDRTVWAPDPGRTTPAHMLTDGVEYFPVSRYVLWGYQFKSVAALGPILGPFIAVQYGWLPALLWIIIGNFFIGWLQDYSSIMVSVRNEGRSFGPITYEFMGSAGRTTLLWFVILYLLIISATFIFFIATFFNIFPGVFWATIGVLVTGVIVGRLLYRLRWNVGLVTLLALIGVGASVVLTTNIPALQVSKGFLGDNTILFWAIVTAVILYLGSVLPLPTFIQPINYVAFFPAIVAIIIILISAVITPITGISLQQDAFKTAYPSLNVGPIWPILFVAIACGAISGWHSLVGSSSTSKQLDVETDARPVGGGAMLTEGLLALASLAAYMVLSNQEVGLSSVGAWVNGATRLVDPWLGGLGTALLATFFGLVLVIYALTVQALVTRFWRLVSAELAGGGNFQILGQKHVATIVGLAIPVAFAINGSWWNLWLYFGASNQLLAGLALMLVSIHLARTRRDTRPSVIPATFMIVTTLSALVWEIWVFVNAVITNKPLVTANTTFANPSFHSVALAFNGIFVIFGLLLLYFGLRMAITSYRAYFRFRGGEAPPTPEAQPQAAPGGAGGQ
jgi:carbon starvation protein